MLNKSKNHLRANKKGKIILKIALEEPLARAKLK